MDHATHAALKVQAECLEEELLHTQFELRLAGQPAEDPQVPTLQTVAEPLDILLLIGITLFCALFSLWLLTVWPALSMFMLTIAGVLALGVRLAAEPV